MEVAFLFLLGLVDLGVLRFDVSELLKDLFGGYLLIVKTILTFIVLLVRLDVDHKVDRDLLVIKHIGAIIIISQLQLKEEVVLLSDLCIQRNDEAAAPLDDI